mgnify:CR=1 FL=1
MEPKVEEDNQKMPRKKATHQLLVYLVDIVESQIILRTIVSERHGSVYDAGMLNTSVQPVHSLVRPSRQTGRTLGRQM